MKIPTSTNANIFRRGDLATVRGFPEIVATLDRSGTLEGLPFLPEMVKYCGQTFTVRWRVNKLLQDYSKAGLRQIKNVVLLDDATCDGEAHGDCQRVCFLLWKTAWIKPGTGEPSNVMTDVAAHPIVSPKPEEPLLPRGHACQATELTAATTPLHLLDPRRYYWDITSRIYKPSAYLLHLLGAVYRRTLRRLFERKHHEEDPLSNAVTSERLGLQLGELVEVKSAEEIRATLNPEGQNRGLYFMPSMWGHCGRRLRVLRPIYRMKSERTGEMRALKQTVILEGVTCNGKAHGGCQRGCYIFWKEIWLRRIPPDLHRPPMYSRNPLGNATRIKGSRTNGPN
jgi:hypothetical protein